MNKSAYTDEELTKHALRFTTRKSWELFGETEVKQGIPSHHRVAFKRGGDFYRKCCAHMPDERGGFRGFKWAEAELIASARRHKARGAWRKADFNAWQAAKNRGIFDECVAHMLPAANPFAADYSVYANEFSDAHCYVGLTVQPDVRKATHACRGPVFDHAQKTGLVPCFRILQSGLTFQEVGSAENTWQSKYERRGWHPLHTARAGSLGSIKTKSRWTREAVLAEARKYKTKQEWIDKSQMSYRIAKREGWFDEASAHMPKRVLGIGAGVAKTAEAREKMRQAKLGKSLSAGHRAKIAASVSTSWKNKSARDVVEALID
jgi:hypothetical protein